MKKTMTIFVLVLFAILALALTGCGENCQHDWKQADCENPKTCQLCGETKDEPLGHSWKAGTCTSPKTCETCGATEDVAQGHSWKDATCEDPKTCTTCGTTEGEPGDHNWRDAHCMEPKTCWDCGKSEGGLGEHEMVDATCEVPQTCAHCGLTVGDPLGHDWVEADCENPKTCLACGLTEEDPDFAPSGHVWQDASCEEPKYCDVCGKTEGEALGHNWEETGESKICTTCGTTEGGAAGPDSLFQTEKCQALFGTWRGEHTITAADLGMTGYEGAITQIMQITFNSDGTAKTVVTIKDADAYVDLMTAYMYQLFEAMGLNKEEADQAAMDQYGMGVREYAAKTCEENNNAVEENVYYVDGDALYMGESWTEELTPAQITIKDDTMTIFDSDSGKMIDFLRV